MRAADVQLGKPNARAFVERSLASLSPLFHQQISSWIHTTLSLFFLRGKEVVCMRQE